MELKREKEVGRQKREIDKGKKKKKERKEKG